MFNNSGYLLAVYLLRLAHECWFIWRKSSVSYGVGSLRRLANADCVRWRITWRRQKGRIEEDASPYCRCVRLFRLAYRFNHLELTLPRPIVFRQAESHVC